MIARVNRQITLASRPRGFPRISDFQLVYASLPCPAAGEVLVHSVYLSLDPHLRQQMSENDSAVPPLAIGEVMHGAVVGFVVASADPFFQAGDAVVGMLGWQEYAVTPGRELRKLDPAIAPISSALCILGAPGLAAYFGLLDIGDPQPGETVVVSEATGAVGVLAGQIAKLRGCRVVGVAAPGAGLDWLLDDLRFDGACNYKANDNFDGTLRELCPEGVDVYFDNVGGAVTDAVVRRLNIGARICLCGQTSQHNLENPESGPRWLGQLIAKQAKAEGFLVSSFAGRYSEGYEQLRLWLEAGKLKCREEIAQGIEAAPQAFIGMLRGQNEGKQLVQLSEL